MGGVRSKVLVAILLRPPEKNLCKQLLGSYLVFPPPPSPWNFCPQWGGGVWIFSGTTQFRKNVISETKDCSMLIIFNDC